MKEIETGWRESLRGVKTDADLPPETNTDLVLCGWAPALMHCRWLVFTWHPNMHTDFVCLWWCIYAVASSHDIEATCADTMFVDLLVRIVSTWTDSVCHIWFAGVQRQRDGLVTSYRHLFYPTVCRRIHIPQKEINGNKDFSLAHGLPNSNKYEGSLTYTSAYHQRVIQIFWLQF